MKKKYQIFISSTYKDLTNEREKVRDTILSMYHFPIGMEMFNAADKEQWAIIQETIDSSDYYVLIIGKRYGSIIEEGVDKGISYTEKEFRYAKRQGIPIIAFIKNDDAVTTNQADMDSERIKKLNSFTRDVTTGRQVDWFSTPDELGMKVSLSLYKEFDRRKRPGWVRGDRIDVDASLNELVKLNQTVRELKEENDRLRASIKVREPKLTVDLVYESMGYGDKKDETLLDDLLGEKSVNKDILTQLPHKWIMRSGYLGNVRPLTMEDVPEDLEGKISQAELDEYNKKLPSQATIETYNEEMFFYNQMLVNGLNLKFNICNDGTEKATDIHVTIDFPESFFIMKRQDVEEREEPDRPSKPISPIDAIYEETLKTTEITGLAAQIANLGYLRNSTFTTSAKPKLTSFLRKNIPTSRPWRLDVRNNNRSVEIWIESLLHTRMCMFDELYVIPMETGKHTIKITTICEEYRTSEETKMEIEVVDIEK